MIVSGHWLVSLLNSALEILCFPELTLPRPLLLGASAQSGLLCLTQTLAVHNTQQALELRVPSKLWRSNSKNEHVREHLTTTGNMLLFQRCSSFL